MSQGGFVTLVGFVAREPTVRTTTKSKTLVADVRVGTTTRVFDQDTGAWRDTDTSYYTVNCWRGLATNAKASLKKGDPVIVKGRFRTHTYTDRQGQSRTEVEIVADTLGHDLSRGAAVRLKQERERDPRDDPRAEGEPDRYQDGEGDDPGPGEVSAPDGPDGDPSPAGAAGSAASPQPEANRLFVDENVSDFGQRLADDEAVARELADSESRESAEAAPF